MKQGFGLIEVLLSLALAGMILTPLIMLQGSSSQFAKRSWQRYDRVSYGLSYAFVSFFAPKNSTALLPKKNQMTLQVNSSAPSDASALKDVAHLALHRVKVSNASRSRSSQDLLLVITHDTQQEES